MKDSVPRELRSRVIYKFTCACCNACYIGETGRHFSTRVREHLSSDNVRNIETSLDIKICRNFLKDKNHNRIDEIRGWRFYACTWNFKRKNKPDDARIKF